MHPLVQRLLLMSALFVGCSNPFSENNDLEITGVWSAQDQSLPIQSVAFLSQGRYFENNVHVGAFTLLDVTERAVGAVSTVFTEYTMRIDYTRGERHEILVRVDPRNKLELRITGISGRGGPIGTFDKLHTGDGL